MPVCDYLLRLTVVIAGCVFGPAGLCAGEIRADPSLNSPPGAVFEGRIEKGDFDKINNFIADGNSVVEIYLASPGGDLAEAAKIGLLIRLLKLSTVVPSKALTNESRKFFAAKHNLQNPTADYKCASACFFIFVAGIHRRHDEGGPPLLAVHRPSVSDNDLKKLSSDQINAANVKIRAAAERYMKEMGVPLTYVEDMFAVPKKRLSWIENEDFERDFEGFIPQLRNLADTRCERRVNPEHKVSSEPTFNAIAEGGTAQSPKDTALVKNAAGVPLCERALQAELASRAHIEALEIRDGKIPQTTLGVPQAPSK